MYDCWDEAAEVDEVELAVAEVAVTEVIKIEVAVTEIVKVVGGVTMKFMHSLATNSMIQYWSQE